MSPFTFSSLRCPLAADLFSPTNCNLLSTAQTYHTHTTACEPLIRLAVMNSLGRGDASFPALGVTCCFMDACILLSWRLLFLRCWINV